MRRLATVLLMAVLLVPLGAARSMAEPLDRVAALSPSVNFGKPARLATAEEKAAGLPDDSGWGLDPGLQQALVGTAILGGAFTLGFVATGSLSTAIGAASAVALSYAVLP